jgi:hypothetical protein
LASAVYRQQKERAFFELAERFRAASDPEQVKRLGDELGRFVFGEKCHRSKRGRGRRQGFAPIW